MYSHFTNCPIYILSIRRKSWGICCYLPLPCHCSLIWNDALVFAFHDSIFEENRFEFEWCFLSIRLRLCALAGRPQRQCCILSASGQETWCLLVPSQVMFTHISWLRRLVFARLLQRRVTVFPFVISVLWRGTLRMIVFCFSS